MGVEAEVSDEGIAPLELGEQKVVVPLFKLKMICGICVYTLISRMQANEN